jgi:hypothetical protein
LGVLFGGLGISKLQYLIKNIFQQILAVKIFQFLAIKTLDPELDMELDPQLEKNSGPGSALNQCGSETLVPIVA